MYAADRCTTYVYAATYMHRRRKRKYSDTRFDKVLSIRDGKVDPLLRCTRVGLLFVARSAARFSKTTYRAARTRSCRTFLPISGREREFDQSYKHENVFKNVTFTYNIYYTNLIHARLTLRDVIARNLINSNHRKRHVCSRICHFEQPRGQTAVNGETEMGRVSYS